MALPEFCKKTQTCHQFITFDSHFSGGGTSYHPSDCNKSDMLCCIINDIILLFQSFFFFCSCSCDNGAGDRGVGSNGSIVTAGGLIAPMMGVCPRLVIILGCWKEEEEEEEREESS